MTQTALIEIHARDLDLEHKDRVWAGLGWRRIHRMVTVVGLDPEFEGVEVGTIRAGRAIHQVWKRHESTAWTTNRTNETRLCARRSKREEDT